MKPLMALEVESLKRVLWRELAFFRVLCRPDGLGSVKPIGGVAVGPQLMEAFLHHLPRPYANEVLWEVGIARDRVENKNGVREERLGAFDGCRWHVRSPSASGWASRCLETKSLAGSWLDRRGTGRRRIGRGAASRGRGAGSRPESAEVARSRCWNGLHCSGASKGSDG